jgi:hypothetical protein
VSSKYFLKGFLEMDTMLFVPTKEGKKQLNLWIPEAVDNELKRLAPVFNLRGRTQVAEHIIFKFLENLPQEQELPGEPSFIADIPDAVIDATEMSVVRGNNTSKKTLTSKGAKAARRGGKK